MFFIPISLISNLITIMHISWIIGMKAYRNFIVWYARWCTTIQSKASHRIVLRNRTIILIRKFQLYFEPSWSIIHHSSKVANWIYCLRAWTKTWISVIHSQDKSFLTWQRRFFIKRRIKLDMLWIIDCTVLITSNESKPCYQI